MYECKKKMKILIATEKPFAAKAVIQNDERIIAAQRMMEITFFILHTP